MNEGVSQDPGMGNLVLKLISVETAAREDQLGWENEVTYGISWYDRQRMP